MKSIFSIPDYLIYGAIVGLIISYANIKNESQGAAKAPDNIGETLPGDSPLDPSTVSYTHLTLPTKA